MRDKITLACSECERRNYSKDKNKRIHAERVSQTKYCRWCRKHVVHKETR
jgi:large subunit ribosomal protein L33